MEIRRRAALREKLAKHERLVDLPLLDFVPALTPRISGDPTERPEHLAPLCDVFDRIEAGEEGLRVLVSVPPQHGKTETISHAVARRLARLPALPLIYASYAQDIAAQKSRAIRDYARAAGVEMREDADSVATWLTEERGGLQARGILGGVTGLPSKGLVVDDPHKNRQEAESALIRQKVFDEFSGSLRPRVHPEGFIVVCGARWHDDDLIGRLSKERKKDGSPVWEVINLPAILPSGKPLWYRRPLEFLEEIRLSSEHDWWSLWMGAPRSRGDRVFKGLAFYDKLPLRYRIGKGVDLAYTAKTTSCYSCGVVLLEDIESDPKRRVYYVVDVRREQQEVKDFARTLSGVAWPGRWHWFTSTTEKGVAQLLSDREIGIEDVLATKDKFARAQAVAAAWNEGRVLLPRQAPWLREFADEIGSFTGVSDKSDDQVDALASAYEGVRYVVEKPRTVPGSGSRFEEGHRGYG